MNKPKKPQTRSEANPSDPWSGSSPLVDLRDSRLRMRARALVEGCPTDADKALAVYNFVRRLPLAAHAKLRLRTAREVLDRGMGDAVDKATLLVALLRLAKLPARLKFGMAPREALRGLGMDVSSLPARPFVEALVDGRWICTDTYIFDSACLAAARHRLHRSRLEFGWALHEDGATQWDALHDAFLLDHVVRDEMLLEHARSWRDPLEFALAHPGRPRLRLLAQLACWSLAAPFLNRRLEALRAKGLRSAARRKRAGGSGLAPLQPARKTASVPVQLGDPSTPMMA